MSRAPGLLLLRVASRGPGGLDFGVPELLSAGAFVEWRTGVRVELLDLVHEARERSVLAHRLEELGPFLLVAAWVDSGFALRPARSLGRHLRVQLPGVPLVAWGPAAAALAGDLREVFDRVVPGEGEPGLLPLVEQRLGGGAIEPGISEARILDDLDAMPPLPWAWLERSLATAPRHGGRLRLAVARGGGRALGADRVAAELVRLARVVEVPRFVVELATPGRGPHRSEVLRELARSDIVPLGYELTVDPDLDEGELASLARARGAVRVLLHSASPTLLRLGWGILDADAHVERIVDACRQARDHRVPWTVEITVGHPGETLQTAVETRQLAESLLATARPGWLSVQPYRLRPGTVVHAQRPAWEASYGTRFHHPAWWRRRYDRAFRAEHLDPSAVLDFEGRVRWMHDEYGPLLAAIHEQAPSVDGPEPLRSRLRRRRQLAERWTLSRTVRDRLLARARAVRLANPDLPLDLDPRDAPARQLEAALRERQEHGWSIAEPLLGALVDAPPGRYLTPGDAREMLDDRVPEPPAEGWAPAAVGFTTWLRGLDALSPSPGERALDLTARSPHVAAVLADLVGELGEVVAVAPDGATADSLRAGLMDRPQVQVIVRGPAHRFDVPGRFDVIWLGAALPRVPDPLRALLTPLGRAVVAVGPRDEPQDVVLVETGGGARVLDRDQWPILGGAEGWLPWPRDPRVPPVGVHRAEGPARFFAALAAADLGSDSLPGTRLDAPWARAIAETWPSCPGRTVLHRLGLAHFDAEELTRSLRWPPSGLRDRHGRSLCAAVATGIEALADRVSGFGKLPESTLAQLEALRIDLWAPQGLRPPPLVLLDVPALGGQSRATTVAGSRRVATSLAMPAEHVLMQVLYEEVGLVAEPGRATAATAEFLRLRAPRHLPTFERWRRAALRPPA